MVRFSDYETDSFDIGTEVLQGDTLELFLFIIGLNYTLWMSIDLIKEKSFSVKKQNKTQEQYSTETITGAGLFVS